MCGIYGMVGSDAPGLLDRMGAALVHRGPDGVGTAVRGTGALGCRRLVLSHLGSEPLRHLGELKLECARDGMTLDL